MVNRLAHKQLYRHGDPLEGLTERELEVLQAAAQGKSSREIGKALCISPQTVHAHLRNIFSKLEVNSRAEAVAYGILQGWISLNGDKE